MAVVCCVGAGVGGAGRAAARPWVEPGAWMEPDALLPELEGSGYGGVEAG